MAPYGDLKVNNLIYETGSGDVSKAVSTIPGSTEMDLKANLAGPTFTGTVTVPTPTAGDNSTKAASTAFVTTSFSPKASPTFTGDITLTGASYNVVFDASDNALEFADNAKAVFGDGPDLSIYHDTNNSYLEDSGTGALILAANQVAIWDAAKAETMFTATENGSVDLYHNNVKKIETSAAGVTVSGSVTDNKGDVRDIPVNAGTSAMTISASDAGKVVATTTGGWVIPTGLSAGNTFTLLNDSGSAQNINATALTTLYNTADGANIKASTIALGARGMATIWCGSGTVAYIQSAALTVS
tara:strand:+ start:1959 stop:2858 length:900 start_codon:yes stop_codon:yes gene_type:complete